MEVMEDVKNNSDIEMNETGEVTNNPADKFWNFLGGIMRWVINLFLKPFHKELSDKVYDFLMQFVKFGVVGVTNTVISYGLYAISLYLFQSNKLFEGFDYIIAQVIAFVLSVLWSFYWNNKLVFVVEEGKKRSWLPALLKTYVSYSFTGLFLNSALLVLWVQLLGISEYIAPMINLVISVPINFLINKFWAFKTKDK